MTHTNKATHDLPFEASFTLTEIQQATRCRQLNPSPDLSVEPMQVCSDTRALSSGDLFIPIQGEQFDGHNYLETAYKKGAAAALITLSWLQKQQNPNTLPWPNLLVVPDTIEAYLALGGFHRQRCQAKVIAITGSSGKTTVKEMLFNTLSPLTRVQCSEKNFNNEIGVSKTLLSLHPDTQVLLVEMGMRGLGEIELLTRHTKPDIAVITNIGTAHIGRLGSRENIAKAKCEILLGLDPKTGTALLNGDDPLLLETAHQVLADLSWDPQHLIKTFSLKQANNISLRPQKGNNFSYQGTPIQLSMSGSHHILNGLAVLHVGELLGFHPENLASGLEAYEVSEGRGQWTPWHNFSNTTLPQSGHPTPSNQWIVDDAYNANPDSFKASLSGFFQQAQSHFGSSSFQTVLILGGMKELGLFTEEHHEQLGQWLGEKLRKHPQMNVVGIGLIGEEAPFIQKGLQTATTPTSSPIYLRPTIQDLVNDLESQTPQLFKEKTLIPTVFYLKGSRSYRLDTFQQLVQERISEQEATTASSTS